MDDLNDLYYFAQVVEHGGFAPAGRALNTPKSKLSRRIALLEERLGVRLLQRSTRHFSVTEIGQEYHRHCLAMLVEAQAAREAIERTRSEPQGLVRMSCPTTLLQYRVGDLVSRFMVEHPKVQVQLEATNRRVDVIGEGLDLALRVRFPPLDSSDLVMRVLGDSPQRLVASPAFLRGLELPLRPADLSGLPSLDWGPPRDHRWCLEGPDGATAEVRHRPRLISDDMTILRRAALRGVGVVQLPCMVVERDLQAGRLLDIMPQWAPRSGVVHALFPSRRGLLPAVRGLIDFLAEHLQQA
ncbi:LysR family transcriptional regulator [Pseudomonas sp. MBLB4123]|uniref:LysR family transcriptional regulator n=1 Tax=Pseudomonas benzenivorans TaxID=556533 RepID=A0ABZ0PY96_9PSED|nr:LysR family transcriptional regulator [Pseudomonas benzenivorans]WPC06134.1 LysR family transcriptional regulator [Pseudomonas benzenivorans]